MSQYRFNELALSDLARIGLVLDGQSVIDWRGYTVVTWTMRSRFRASRLRLFRSRRLGAITRTSWLALGYLDLHEYGDVLGNVRRPDDIRNLLI